MPTKERIALINPPSPFLINERVMPNLGLLYVATEMSRQGLDVRVFDFCGDPDYRERMRQVALDGFDSYGFSTTTPQFSQAYGLFRILKEHNPNAFAFIGGPHPTSVAPLKRKSELEGTLMDPNIAKLEEFDLVIEGDGELAYAEISKEGPRWRAMPVNRDMDSIPIPNRDFYDIMSYHYRMAGRDATSIITQRGCPFKCDFCCGRDIPSYKISRLTSPKRVLEELDYLNGEFGFTAFIWGDDELNLNKKRMAEMAKLFKNKDYVHKSAARPDLFVKFPETAEMAAEIGFVEICCGIESGSQRILNNIMKGTNVESNLESVELLRRQGILYKAFIMLGHAGETYEDVMMTRQWLLDAKPDFFDTALLQPYPGSIVYDRSVPSTRFEGYGYSYGPRPNSPPEDRVYLNRPDFSERDSFYKGVPGKFVASTRTEALSAEDYLKLRDELEAEVKAKLYGTNGNKSKYLDDTRSRLAAAAVHGSQRDYF